ncbi:F0F1 ATP synthase subunit epsilon [Terrarubrum flagellatum]|uniref:F0F1 ATP synthase subunit epsilon n=1 Tax=Terrirubrum flagellatum TaxID=2895980 RepID=UPI003145173A
MASFHFELVSPEKMLFSGDVESVVVPGADGDFQVFAGHAPVMSTLHVGVLKIAGNTNAPQRVFVRGGFADVNDSGLTILAEQAVDLAEVKSDQLMQDIRDLEEDVADAKTDAERARAQAKLEGLKALQLAVAH